MNVNHKRLIIILIFAWLTSARETFPIKKSDEVNKINNDKNLNVHKNSINTSSSLKSAANLKSKRSHLTHMSGNSRKIQLYIKNHYVQLIPSSNSISGIVNGTINESSNYCKFSLRF